MFVMANSDMPFNPQYVKPTQLPATIQGQIATAAVGQTLVHIKSRTSM
jgi:peptidyl-prolyl cis-trans isomerase D